MATLTMSGRDGKIIIAIIKGANPGMEQDIDETHSSWGRAASLVGGRTLSIYSISNVSSCVSPLSLVCPGIEQAGTTDLAICRFR